VPRGFDGIYLIKYIGMYKGIRKCGNRGMSTMDKCRKSARNKGGICFHTWVGL
jgi:hypothetical protein